MYLKKLTNDVQTVLLLLVTFVIVSMLKSSPDSFIHSYIHSAIYSLVHALLFSLVRSILYFLSVCLSICLSAFKRAMHVSIPIDTELLYLARLYKRCEAKIIIFIVAPSYAHNI